MPSFMVASKQQVGGIEVLKIKEEYLIAAGDSEGFLTLYRISGKTMNTVGGFNDLKQNQQIIKVFSIDRSIYAVCSKGLLRKWTLS